MSKLRLLAVVLATVSFLLSLWVVPIALVVIGAFFVETMWIRVVLCGMGVLWMLLVRPWNIFYDPRFGNFITDLRRAFNALIN